MTWASNRVALIATLLILSSVLAWGQKGNGVEVRAISPPQQDTEPGRVLSLSFLVTNTAQSDEELVETLQLPTDWQTIIPASSFILRPAEETSRVFALRIPMNTGAGPYQVTYSVRSQRDYAIQDAATVSIVVLPVSNLLLLVEEKPDAVIAGDEYSVKLRVVNQGNGALDLKMSVTSADNYPATVEPTAVSLAAGASEVVTVTVRTDPNEGQPRKHVIQVRAEAQPPLEKSPAAKTAVVVDIIPKVTRKADPYRRLPATLALRATGRNGRNGMQAELRGGGILDPESGKSVAFLLRGPDIQAESFFGERDEYWLNYSSDQYRRDRWRSEFLTFSLDLLLQLWPRAVGRPPPP